MSWSRRFAAPIVLDNGTEWADIRRAIEYLAKTVPKTRSDHAKVLTRPITVRALPSRISPCTRAATLRAIYRHRVRIFNPERKDHHWGKRELKRDP